METKPSDNHFGAASPFDCLAFNFQPIFERVGLGNHRLIGFEILGRIYETAYVPKKQTHGVDRSLSRRFQQKSIAPRLKTIISEQRIALEMMSLDHACRFLDLLKSHGIDDVFITVNLGRETLSKPGIVDTIKRTAARYLEDRRVKFELIETAKEQTGPDSADVTATIQQLGGLTDIFMDDFMDQNAEADKSRLAAAAPFISGVKLGRPFIDAEHSLQQEALDLIGGRPIILERVSEDSDVVFWNTVRMAQDPSPVWAQGFHPSLGEVLPLIDALWLAKKHRPPSGGAKPGAAP